MGRKNRNKYHKSLHQLAHDRLKSMQAFGQSKRADMQMGLSADKIYSYATYQTYKKHINYYLRWLKTAHPEVTTLRAAKRHAREWLELRADKRNDDGKYRYSAWTIQTEAAALNKLFGIDKADPDRFIPPVRRREDIYRSRKSVSRDRHFSETNNAELIEFCKGTGCRRNVLQRLTGDDLWSRERMQEDVNLLHRQNSADRDQAHLNALRDALSTFPDEDYFVHHRKDKGGRSRFAPIIGPRREEIIARMKDRRPDEKVWQHISSAADIHSYRADYATRMYRMHAREYDAIPYDRVNEKTGIKYKSEVYYCRKEERGRRLDRKAMLIASKALGHNRIDVIAANYLRACRHGGE